MTGQPRIPDHDTRTIPMSERLVARQLYVGHELRLQGEDFGQLCQLFGMHMAFDEGDGQALEDRIEQFGWRIVEREHSTDCARMSADDAV